MAIYGYVRVSSADQNENRQYDAMKELKLRNNRIFADKQSGKDFNRAAWNLMIKRLTKGDLLYVQSIDRMGRNYEEIQNWWRILTKEKGVDICIVDMPILDTRIAKDLLGTVINDIILQLLSYMAQNERETTRKRQAEGIESAKKRGVKFGRPTKKPPENFDKLAKEWEQSKLRTKDFMEITGLSESTLYRQLKERGYVRKK